MAINIPETCGEVECAVRGSGVTECGEFEVGDVAAEERSC